MSVYVNNRNNQVDVTQTFNTVNVLPDENSTIVQIVTPGPQGPQGPPGDPSIFTGSFVSISSFNNFTASYNTGSFTGSFIGNGSGLFGIISASFSNTASFAISASRATSASFAATSSYSSNINGLTKYIPLFDTENSLSSSAIHQSNSYSIIINRDFGTANAPEALFVFQPNTESINVATFESNVNNYSQINTRNESSGNLASSDIVATADNGDEFTNFVNMGINSSTFTGSIGGPNDAYIFSTGNNLTIGNDTPNKHIRVFTGGGLVENFQKFVLNPDDLHEMTGSLDISEFAIIRKGLTVQTTGSQDVFIVSESIVRIIPQASDPVGTTDVGSIWFTSTAMYVGLD
jgi:hypothetical protein